MRFVFKWLIWGIFFSVIIGGKAWDFPEGAAKLLDPIPPFEFKPAVQRKDSSSGRRTRGQRSRHSLKYTRAFRGDKR